MGSSLHHAEFFAAVHRLFSRPAAWGILVPRPGTEPRSSALQDGFLTTGPPGKSLGWSLLRFLAIFLMGESLLFWHLPWPPQKSEPNLEGKTKLWFSKGPANKISVLKITKRQVMFVGSCSCPTSDISPLWLGSQTQPSFLQKQPFTQTPLRIWLFSLVFTKVLLVVGSRGEAECQKEAWREMEFSCDQKCPLDSFQ